MVLMDDCVVLVLKPAEFHRKKAAMAAAGSQAMQVLTHTTIEQQRQHTNERNNLNPVPMSAMCRRHRCHLRCLQVFCDFEHVLTHAKVPYTASSSSSLSHDSDMASAQHGQGSPTDPPRPLQRSLGSGEVLECAPGAIAPSAVQQLRAVAGAAMAIPPITTAML